MKFKILVKDSKGEEWEEEYDENIKDAQKWAEKTIQQFNETLRSHELPRELISVTVLNNNNEKFHKWTKMTDKMSVPFRGTIADFYYCKKCGVTGKRYGLNSRIQLDSKFKKKCFQNCDTAQKELGRVK